MRLLGRAISICNGKHDVLYRACRQIDSRLVTHWCRFYIIHIELYSLAWRGRKLRVVETATNNTMARCCIGAQRTI